MHIICCKQKEESFFFVTPIKMRVSGWVFNQLKSLTDRLTFFPQNCLWGGGEGGGGPNQKRTLGWGGYWSQKKSPDLRSPEVGISDDIICLNTICPLSCNYNSYFIIISFFNNVLPQLQVLHETALIEAFNLKAGIEYQLKNCKLLVIFTGSLKIFVITEMSCVRLKINFKVIHPANFLWFVWMGVPHNKLVTMYNVVMSALTDYEWWLIFVDCWFYCSWLCTGSPHWYASKSWRG